MLGILAHIIVSYQAEPAAVRAAARALHRFGVVQVGVGRASPSGGGAWQVRFDRPNNVFRVELGPDLKLNGIGWGSTSGAYRAPKRAVWTLPSKQAAKVRLDALGKQIEARYPVKWEQYSYQKREPGNLAFRASASQHFAINGHPVFMPNVGYSVVVSPIDGELRGLWISDTLPTVVPGPAKITASDAQAIVRRSAAAGKSPEGGPDRNSATTACRGKGERASSGGCHGKRRPCPWIWPRTRDISRLITSTRSKEGICSQSTDRISRNTGPTALGLGNASVGASSWSGESSDRFRPPLANPYPMKLIRSSEW